MASYSPTPQEDIKHLPVPASPRMDATRPPRHTVASIAISLGLVAAALYGVQLTVAAPEGLVHVWDFRRTSHEGTPWSFPMVSNDYDGRGIQSLAYETGPGPMFEQPLETDSIGEIRVTMEINRYQEETPVPFTLEWYWASQGDIDAAGEAWPFSTERGVTLHPSDPSRPETHSARLDHAKWTGTIARGFIGLKFPDEVVGPFIVRTIRVEFLE